MSNVKHTIAAHHLVKRNVLTQILASDSSVGAFQRTFLQNNSILFRHKDNPSELCITEIF